MFRRNTIKRMCDEYCRLPERLRYQGGVGEAPVEFKEVMSTRPLSSQHKSIVTHRSSISNEDFSHGVLVYQASRYRSFLVQVDVHWLDRVVVHHAFF